MSIADFLFSRLQQKLLAPLLLNPERQFNLTELLAYAGTVRNAGQLQIFKMLSVGLLQEERIGNVRQLHIKKAFPFYAELRSICLKSFGLKQKIFAMLKPFAA